MTTIDAKARNVRELLGGRKYTIDYFQREYRWQAKQLGELIADLTERFLSAWKPQHPRSEVARYPAYFLGSIIISREGGRSSVIDGQQRLTSLSILLIWTFHHLKVEEDKRQIADLIFTRQFGANSYNLDVPERAAAMEALYMQRQITLDGASESVRNILIRYEDIEENMPTEIVEDGLAMFADWLIERVYLVEIQTPSDDDGYEIFEAMNDRGLPLTPTDMLKSHLLASAGDEDTRARLNGIWKKRIDELLQINSKEGDADAIKSWLRGRHAQSIRERQAGATAEDFDRIGSEFHRWVRDSAALLGLSEPADYARFVERDFEFYTEWYIRLCRAAAAPLIGREAIFSNALANFTLQFPMMLAPIKVADSEPVGWQKAMLVATFIDILIARRSWHGRSADYSTMQYAMFLVIKEIRDLPVGEMANFLKNRLEYDTKAFSANNRFGLAQSNKKTIRRFLARMTSWLDQKVGHGGNLSAYLTSGGVRGYDIEHVMADGYGRYEAEFITADEFLDYRNRIGALLLLPRSFNRSYGGLGYEEKRQHYLQQNTLAQTLHEDAYRRNPGLRRVIQEFGIGFQGHTRFGREEVEARQVVYAQLAEAIWSTDKLREIAEVEPTVAA